MNTAECQKEMMARGEPYPRTCPTCGFGGSCAKGYDPKWTPQNPVGIGPEVTCNCGSPLDGSHDHMSCGPPIDQILENMVHATATTERYGRMTNKELVAACAKSEAADYLVVAEMMSRLDPHWADEKPNMRLTS